MNRITEFVDSLIPKNLPKKRAASLKEELTCHILDKRDYYKEIGYGENDSIDKAIAAFGTDEESKNFIYKEFEELYSEKSIFGIMAFVIIAFMNILCLPLDIWVTSADFNREPDPAGAFISFSMIFAVLLMISFARIKKYRKMLISIGVANTLIACSLLTSFYPQMAAYTIGDNIIYFIDRFTPISMGETIVMANDGLLIMVLWWAILLIPALYCFVESVRIKKGTAKSVSQPKRKVAVFGALFLIVSLISCFIQPTSQTYIDDYPVWFSSFQNFISEESKEKFDDISIGETYSEVSNRLKSEGYMPIDSYKKSLDRLTKKQFVNALKEFTFADGYEIWFHPEIFIAGNGFIGLKQENGIITAKGIGNMEENMYSGKYNNFGYSGFENNCDMSAMTDYFRKLSKGDSETEVMSRFGEDLGVIYTKRISAENGEARNYYRVYCCGEVHSEAKLDYEKNDSRYIELTFKNGKLSNGTMYYKIYLDQGTTVETEMIK